MFRRRFWVCLALTIPVLIYSEHVQMLLGFSPPRFSGSEWVAPVLSVIIFFYGGLPFLQMAAPEIRNHKPGMMTLISLAITVAFVYSLVTVFIPIGADFFWELATLVTIMLLGHWLEMRSVRQASGALDELAKLLPDTAERVTADGRVEQVPVARLVAGDVFLVRPGGGVPADGEVIEGQTDVNEAMITGESRPVKKEPGSQVIAGTINSGDGSLRARVTAVGEATALAGIMRLVQDAQQSKSHTQLLADRAAGWLFYVALAVAAITLIAWTAAIGFGSETIARVVTVLVIACPHALGLAVPLVVAITTSLSARNGILVRDRSAMETIREANVVIFDKTGTLTQGAHGVVGMTAIEGTDEVTALALAAAVERDSEHFIARAFRKAAEERGLSLPAIQGFEALKGRGVRAESGDETVYVGGPRLLEMLSLQLPTGIEAFTEGTNRKGQSVIYLVRGEQVVAAFALADVIRPESREAVRRLREMGVEVAMLTGDSEAVAAAVAGELGIDRYFAGVLPETKDRQVAQLQAEGKRVVMVGDGVNDAPALTRADVGVAIGGGTDVAVESAGIVLVRSDPLDVVKTIELSRASYRKMIQNLWWAAGYNIIALPLAAGVLAPLGILLSPAAGAVLMSLSTIIVSINAQLLRRVKLD
ncbi:MAG: copper-translocating P-type ATPase [Candidatus Promineofilum sp.]|nr:copper-translocating P-type ATPase [Promineifilum sp.]MBP9657758.1 copper-translocating P-type ATPase [Promineifilum sp.]